MIRTIPPKSNAIAIPETSNNSNVLQIAKKHRGGRPRKELNYRTLDRLCKLQCTGQECAAILNMSYDTLDARLKEEMGKPFQEYFLEKGASGKKSLRRKQWELALSGDKTMLIWLGKQYLGQADRQELTGANGGPIKSEQKTHLASLTNDELVILEKALSR